MPVRKNTPAKSTPAKKAAPAAKKPAAKKSSASSGLSEEQLVTVGKLVLAALKNGDLDFMLVEYDDALTARINKTIVAQEKKEAAAKKDAPKSASPAPKRTTTKSEPAKKETPAKSLTLTANKFYKIGNSPVKLKGAKVKYLKPSPKDENKVVVELAVDLPGYPKGKRVVIPKSALVAAAR